MQTICELWVMWTWKRIYDYFYPRIFLQWRGNGRTKIGYWHTIKRKQSK